MKIAMTPRAEREKLTCEGGGGCDNPTCNSKVCASVVCNDPVGLVLTEDDGTFHTCLCMKHAREQYPEAERHQRANVTVPAAIACLTATMEGDDILAFAQIQELDKGELQGVVAFLVNAYTNSIRTIAEAANVKPEDILTQTAAQAHRLLDGNPNGWG